MVILESVPSIYRPNRLLFRTFEYVTVYVFAAEYALRLWCSVEDPRIGADHPVSGRVKFAARPMMIIDFLAFAPFFITAVTGGVVDLRALRVLRLLRLLKITRYVQGVSVLLGVVYAERRALVGTGILLICSVCFLGEIMRLVEGPGQPKVFGTLPGGMWWAMLTLATVGYGDATPLTLPGKLVAGLSMVWGLMLYAMPIGIISKGFVDSLHRRQFNVTWSMMSRHALFADLGVDVLGQIMDQVGASLVADHSRIAVAGAPAETFWLIVSGRALAEDADGDHLLEAGDMIGEEALGEDAVYGRTVVARRRRAADVAAGRGAAPSGAPSSGPGAAGARRGGLVRRCGEVAGSLANGPLQVLAAAGPPMRAATDEGGVMTWKIGSRSFALGPEAGVAAALLCHTAACAAAAPAAPDPVLAEATGLGGPAIFLSSGAPGMVLVVVKGERSLVLGYGETAKGNGHAPDGASLVRLNSITKVFATEVLADPGGARRPQPHRSAGQVHARDHPAELRGAADHPCRPGHPLGRAAPGDERKSAGRGSGRATGRPRPPPAAPGSPATR